MSLWLSIFPPLWHCDFVYFATHVRLWLQPFCSTCDTVTVSIFHCDCNHFAIPVTHCNCVYFPSYMTLWWFLFYNPSDTVFCKPLTLTLFIHFPTQLYERMCLFCNTCVTVTATILQHLWHSNCDYFATYMTLAVSISQPLWHCDCVYMYFTSLVTLWLFIFWALDTVTFALFPNPAIKKLIFFSVPYFRH